MADTLRHILEAGGTELSTSAGGARRYRKPLTAIRWRDITAILNSSLAGWNKHNAPRLGASLAFYTLLSIAPLLLVLVSVIGLLVGGQRAQAEIVTQVHSLIGPQGALAVRALMEGSHNKTHGIIATAFGLLSLLFGASGVVIELREALNTIWEAPTPELKGLKKIAALIRERLFSFALVLGIGFVLVVSLAVSTFFTALASWSASVLPSEETLLHIVNMLVSFVIITALFSAIYKFLPDVHLQWRDVVLGGAVTSALFEAGKLLIGLYLGKASFASTYGAAASIVILIVWVYYSGQIFFLGAEFTRVFAHCYGSQPGAQPAEIVTAAGVSPKERTEQPRIILP
jgi:membrane protein